MFCHCKKIFFAFFLSRANRIKTITYGISPMLFFKYIFERVKENKEERKERVKEK
jgi:hypothetical protein